MFERLKKLALTPIVWPSKDAPPPIEAPPRPPVPILTPKGVICSKCSTRALTFVTATTGVRYCVKCWTLLAARRTVS
jgi:hypothetical protein